jgi:SnoaL-like domain
MGGATVAPESWCDADMPTKVQVQVWLDAYVAAWRSYERDAIVALFTDDVAYQYHPYDEPLLGAEAVAGSWLEEQDAPGTWEAEYAPALIAGDEVIATGETRYTDGQVFSNLWQLTFAPDGRCSRFVEWYVLQR